ncbi:DUF3329 domain-containing protein [Companilactobacillus kedongensis]|uniref:DUF3329 domain-containing protein n=1 Tax=Companilactobacillus kedongensis TaxID=2486004 RepID=UPI000F777D0D|nr:DUF6056 family protein [Companilactobacillus kedongensis]
MNSSNKRKYLLPGLLYLGTFLVVFTLNHFSLLTADDYTYHFFYDGPSVTPHTRAFHSLFDIFASQYNHYFMWNGRILAHSFVQIMMQFPKWVFDIVNTFVFLGLVILIKQITQSLIKKSLPIFLEFLVVIALWFFLPLPGTTIYWISGAGNYLWMSIFYLSFLLFGLKNLEKKSSIWMILGAMILGFLAGTSSENSGPSVVIMLVLFGIYYLRDFKKIRVWHILGIIASMAGSLLIILSPASQGRGDKNSIILLLVKFLDILKLIKNNSMPLMITFLVVVILTLMVRVLKKDDYANLIILFIGFLASLFSLMLSPAGPLEIVSGSYRAFFGPYVFMIIMMAYMLYRVYQRSAIFDMNSVKWVITALSLIVFTVSFSKAYTDIHSDYVIQTNNIQKINAAKADGKDTVTIKILPNLENAGRTNQYNAINYTANTLEDPASWLNVWMAKYYGIKSISGTFK